MFSIDLFKDFGRFLSLNAGDRADTILRMMARRDRMKDHLFYIPVYAPGTPGKVIALGEKELNDYEKRIRRWSLAHNTLLRFNR